MTYLPTGTQNNLSSRNPAANQPSAIPPTEASDTIVVKGKAYSAKALQKSWTPIRSSRGDYYWYNSITHQCTWQTPEGHQDPDAPAELPPSALIDTTYLADARRQKDLTASTKKGGSSGRKSVEKEARPNTQNSISADQLVKPASRGAGGDPSSKKPLPGGTPSGSSGGPGRDPATAEAASNSVSAQGPEADSKHTAGEEEHNSAPHAPALPSTDPVPSRDQDEPVADQTAAFLSVSAQAPKQTPDADAGLYQPRDSTWSPSMLFDPKDTKRRYFVVMLNQPISDSHLLSFERLWSRAAIRICADGAANRLHDLFRGRGFISVSKVTSGPHRVGIHKMLPPDEIIGDLDSLREDVREFFVTLGTKIIHRPSQYSTDLQKSLQRLEDLEDDFLLEARRDVVIHGGLSGRFDQTNHTLHVLWQLAAGVPVLDGVYDPNAASDEANRGGELQKRAYTFVVNEDSVVWLLSRGTHTLHHDRRLLGKTCGILPLGIGMQGGGARVTTQGLVWNLTSDTTTHLGGLLSTSNALAGDGTVTITTDTPVYWSVELKSDEEITEEVRKGRQAARARPQGDAGVSNASKAE